MRFPNKAAYSEVIFFDSRVLIQRSMQQSRYNITAFVRRKNRPGGDSCRKPAGSLPGTVRARTMLRIQHHPEVGNALRCQEDQALPARRSSEVVPERRRIWGRTVPLSGIPRPVRGAGPAPDPAGSAPPLSRENMGPPSSLRLPS